MNLVIIMRGPSGAGKSTWIKQHYPEAVPFLHLSPYNHQAVVSADHFFQRADGYWFDPTKLGEAHATCMRHFIIALSQQVPVVIVDNTHTRRWEWENYRLLAEGCGYEVQVQTLLPQTVAELGEMVRRNVHGVPAGVIAQMALEFEP